MSQTLTPVTNVSSITQVSRPVHYKLVNIHRGYQHGTEGRCGIVIEWRFKLKSHQLVQLNDSTPLQLPSPTWAIEYIPVKLQPNDPVTLFSENCV